MGAASESAVAPDTSLRAVRITAVVLCVFGTGVIIREFYRIPVVFPGAVVLAVAIEVPVLAVGCWLIRLLRPVRAPSRVWSGAAVIWGATAATGCALLANAGMVALWAKSTGIGFSSDWSAALTAPLNEEILKLSGVVMILLAAPGRILGPLDGMIYGALTGLGFQVTENVIYGLNSIAQSGATDPAASVASSAAVRVGLTVLGSHWTMTAVAGAGIGYVAALGPRRGAAPALACLAAAMGMHLLFDAPRLPTAVKVAVNLAIVAAFYLTLRRRFRAHALEAVNLRVTWGDLSDAEAMALLSRHSRRNELRSARPGRERDQLAARQLAAMDSIEADAS